MRKSLAISNIVMLVAAFFCLAIFGAGAVWAYNANLAMKLPANFAFSSLTLTANNAQVYSNGTMGNGFAVMPVAEDTLEISANYETYGTKTITFSSDYMMTLENAVAYGVDLGVSDIYGTQQNTYSNDYISYTIGANTLQIKFLAAVALADGDNITLQIKFSDVAVGANDE